MKRIHRIQNPTVFLAIQMLVCLASIPIQAQRSWTLELSGGGAYCLQTPLTIRQSGYDDIEMSAQYDTRSFTPPLYYALRLGVWQNARAWEAELIHLKLELANAPDTVQRFAISHGYNIFTLNRAWLISFYTIRLGAGVVIAHPENTVCAQAFDEHTGIMQSGYAVAGPAVQAALSTQLPVNPHISVGLEGKITGSYARIPIANGHAAVPQISLHALLGVGYTF